MQAYGGPQYQLKSQVPMCFAGAIETGKVPIVPNLVIGGSGDKGAGDALVEVMLAMPVADKAGGAKRPDA